MYKDKIISNYRFIELAEICYLLDLIDKAAYKELLEINKTRNAFAHKKFKDMSEREIEKKCENWLKINEKIFDLYIELHDKNEKTHKHPKIGVDFSKRQWRRVETSPKSK